MVGISPCHADSIEILAIGASQTNGRGLPSKSSYPAQLEALLRSDGYDVSVINSGIDGQQGFKIFYRMTQEVNQRTKIVIFEESGNDLRNKSSGIEYAEKALSWLRDHHIPAIFTSSPRIQSDEDARLLAEKYGATYYGRLKKDVPEDSEHMQPGQYFSGKNAVDYHLTEAGYRIVATNMLPIVKKIIAENNLASPK